MSKFVETIIDRFDGGITDDPRELRGNVSQITTNFNALLNTRRLIPYRDSEDGDTASSTQRIQNFCVAQLSAGTFALYGLGVTSGTSQAEVYYKNLSTDANGIADQTWTETANNAAGTGTRNVNCFVYYQKTNYIYGATSGTHIWRYDPDGTDAFAATHQAITYTDIAQGLVHSKDDILYIPYDNKIAKNDNGSWTTAALTLPTHFVITSICEYGNYLAIACAPLNGGITNSRVYLWDRDATLTTLSESIDWGAGSLVILDTVDGELVGISQIGGVTSSGMPLSASTSFADRVIFRRLVGNVAVKFKELLTGSTTTQLPIAKQVFDNRLFFMMLTSLYGATREGVWSVGRTPTGELAVVHERTPNNDTALSTGTLHGFYLVGEYMFQSFTTSAAVEMTKTNDSSSYTATSIYETKILNDGDASLVKRLHGVSVMTEYLPTAGQVVVRYRKDEETSFTTIITTATDNEVSHSAINIESSGAVLPEYKEITFRIQSTGGAVITGLSWKSEIVGKRVY